MGVGDFMRCPNCHGEIEESLATCPMCNYILDYDKVDINKDLDKISRQNFIIQQNLLFIVKLIILFFLIGYISILVYGVIIDPDRKVELTNLILPVFIDIVCIALVVITIRGKRRWK